MCPSQVTQSNTQLASLRKPLAARIRKLAPRARRPAPCSGLRVRPARRLDAVDDEPLLGPCAAPFDFRGPIAERDGRAVVEALPRVLVHGLGEELTTLQMDNYQRR